MSIDRHDRKTRAALVVLPFLGAMISGALLVEHGGGWQVPWQGASFLARLCDPVQGESPLCTEVAGSHFGEFDVYVRGRRLVFPTSYLGLAYFLTLSIWFGIIFRARSAGRWLRLATWGGIATGLAVSLALVAVMALVLGAWCALCGAAHAVNAAVVVIAARWLRATRSPADRAPNGWSEPSMRLRFAASGALLIAAVVGGSWLYYDAMREARRQWRKARGYADAVAVLQSDPELMLHAYYAQPSEWPEPGDAFTSAPEVDAATRVTLFVDYDSGGSACFEKRFNEQFQPWLPGPVQVAYRHIPARSSSAAPGGVTPEASAVQAARAAEAARRLGGEAVFECMRRWLFASRHDPDARDVPALADRAGLNVARFQAEMDSDAVAGQVVADVAMAHRLGVRHAPAAFLNGRRVPDICLRSEAFWRAVGEDIRRARASARQCVDMGIAAVEVGHEGGGR
ncbi:MAG: vitamin K epoxide reductase family protein [Phycisphaerae bacterium]